MEITVLSYAGIRNIESENVSHAEKIDQKREESSISKDKFSYKI